VRYDADHFEPYTSHHFEEFVADQLDFLQRVAPVTQQPNNPHG
jgi:hypothetical protein